MKSKGDFEAAYLEYSDKIFRFLYWQTGDIHIAEDLTSEVFVRAWKSRKTFKGQKPQAWLYRIARNLLIDYWRRKKEVTLPDIVKQMGAYDDDLLEQLIRAEAVQQLRQALDRLPENLRSVLVLRFIERLSAKEVGKIMDIGEGNVRVLQHRALVKLREVYGNGKTV